MPTPFPCTSCGACCRRAPASHPDWPKRTDGACINLNPDNTCAIYEVRPLVCRVEDMRPKEVTEEAWHYACALTCNAYQEEDYLDEALRVRVVPADLKTLEKMLPEVLKRTADLIEDMSKND